jgi:hypothetical protein
VRLLPPLISFSENTMLHNNIARAVETTFNIKTAQRSSVTEGDHKSNDMTEVGGLAIVSQDCQVLQDLVTQKGYSYKMADFIQYGRWSCINIDKIKVLWSERVRQASISGGLYNIVPGYWKSDSMFIADTPADVEVRIIPKGGITHHTGDKVILIPYNVHKMVTDISDIVPVIKFEGRILQCVSPIDIKTISVCRRGIYINRKFRQKIELTELDETFPQPINKYRLQIIHRSAMILDIDIRYNILGCSGEIST